MNIFVLDTNPTLAAKYHCDIHCRKQLEESVQMLCSALRRHKQETPPNKSGEPHKGGYPNHPCTQWAGDGLLNYQWLWELAYELGKECKRRFNKEYYSYTLLRDGLLPRYPLGFPVPPTRTPFPNCTSDWLKSADNWDDKKAYHKLNGVDKYRLYYMMDKCHLTSTEIGKLNKHWKSEHTLREVEWDEFSIWTNNGAPEFMSDRFYTQQCEFFGIKPAELIHAERYPEKPESIKLRDKMYKKLGNKATGTVRTATKKQTKADVVVEIFDTLNHSVVAGFDKLTMVDLQKVKLGLVEANSVTEMPSGRTKKPYVLALQQALNCDADFSKLTIATLKELLTILGA